MRCPKPARRGPKPRKPIRRRAPVAKRSAKRSQVDAADARWSSEVRKRDHNTCVLCLSPATDAHHWYGKKAHPALRYVVVNGIPLCREHHDTVHAYPKFFKAKFAVWYPARAARLAAMVRSGRRPA